MTTNKITNISDHPKFWDRVWVRYEEIAVELMRTNKALERIAKEGIQSQYLVDKQTRLQSEFSECEKMIDDLRKAG